MLRFYNSEESGSHFVSGVSMAGWMSRHQQSIIEYLSWDGGCWRKLLQSSLPKLYWRGTGS